MTPLAIWVLCAGCFAAGFIIGGMIVIVGNRNQS